MYKTLFGLFLLSLLALNACHNSVRDLDNSTQATFDFAQSENLINDIWKQVHLFSASDSVLNGIPTGSDPFSCPDTIYRVPDMGPFPITLTLDYGNTAKVCADGRMRKGKIMATFTGLYFAGQTEVFISTENYAVGNVEIFAKFNLTVLDTLNDRLKFSKKIDTAVFAQGNQQLNKRSFYKGENTVELSSFLTPMPLDDVFWESGAMQGVATTGNSYSVVITNPIVFDMLCNWEYMGEFTQEIPNLSTRKGDIGSGSNICDNNVSVIINNAEYQVSIP